MPFRNEQVAPFDRSLVQEIFGAEAASIARNGEIVDIVYPDGQRAELYGAEEETIKLGLVFSRAGGDRIFDGIWQIADRTRSLIYWPDIIPHCAVTRPETLALVPSDVLESMGPAEIVKSGQELQDYIFRDD